MQRTQPWLGTLVTVGLHGAPAARAERLFARIFEEIATVHRLMSFHEAGSDVSRLNRDAWRKPVAVDARTLEVLRLAQRVSAASAGRFDITVAPRLVDDGFLPRPDGTPPAHPAARWRDIALRRDGRVRFRRPLWIDLGGIAKGYAVDAAFRAAGALRGATLSVNAGGDLRVAGPLAVQVAVAIAGPRSSSRPSLPMPQLTLSSAALASSQGLANRRRQGGRWRGPHRHGRTHRALPLSRFASVIAPSCAIADALTKLVLARGRAAAPQLRRFGAAALLHEPGRGWQRIGVAQ